MAKSYFERQPSELASFSFNIIKSGILARHRIKPDNPVPLTFKPSPLVKNLNMIVNGEGHFPNKGLIVSTLRMGYGHHRIGYAVYSRALARGKEVFLHDVLSIDCPESRAIQDIDQAYSFLSRLSSEWGGPLEWAWGVATSQGNFHSLHFSCMLADELKNLATGLPRELPLISSHPLNGQIAVAAGFKKVVNLIPDNNPQYYLLVPDALNLVQSASQYAKFREWGVPKENLAVAGHWVSNDVARYARKDARNRVRRAEKKMPRRIFLPVGGAGAQRSFILDFLKAFSVRIKDGSVRIIANTGDHIAILQGLESYFVKQQIAYQKITTWPELLKFCDENELSSGEPAGAKPVVLCGFENYHEAIMATEHLIRVCDIMMTKPSELAFYPVPKVFTRRVGEHEGPSANRSQELGDGTTECRSVEEAVTIANLLVDTDDVFFEMNDNIIRNSRAGVYSGCKVAIAAALG